MPKKQPIQTFLFSAEKSKHKNSRGETIILLEWNPKDYIKGEVFLDYGVDDIVSYYKNGKTNRVVIEFSKTSRDSCLYLISVYPKD